MKASPPRLHTAHLTADEKALQRCESGPRLKDRGEYFKSVKSDAAFVEGVGNAVSLQKRWSLVDEFWGG